MRILKTLHWSRRRSGSGVADIHLQQSQLQDNNNGLVPRDTKESIECVGPDGMWAPGSTPGHHRELPVDVPDTLLQQAYANKVMTTDPKNNHHRNEIPRRNRNASIDKLSSPLPPLPPTLPPQSLDIRELSLNQKNESTNVHLRPYHNQKHNSNNKLPILSGKMKDTDEKLPRIIEITVQNNNKHNEIDTNNIIKSRELLNDDEIDSGNVERKIHTSDVKETNVDVEDDYPFAKEDYPTMLKTCSDDSASPRSSSGRSDSTAALDASLILPGKESPLYDARRIDLGSPCRTMPDLGPLFGLTTRETTSFDNPAYGLDLHDFHPGLLIRSDEVTDLTRLIGEQTTNSRRNSKLNQDKNLPNKGPISRVGDFAKSSLKKSKNKQTLITKDSEYEGESLIGVSSTDDLLSADLTSFVSNTSIKKQRSSGYSTLRSDASNDHHNDHSFLITGNNNRVYREVAVDCPPDFIPITKSHPIYPPPNKIDNKRDINFETQNINKRKDNSLSLKDKLNYPNVLSTFESSSSSSIPTATATTTTTSSQIDGNIKACIDDHNSLIDDESTNEHKHVKANINGIKPAIPPRDQKRAPARPPKDNVRLSSRNNNLGQNDNINKQSMESQMVQQPTPQQLHSIKKYQEQMRQRKDHEERQEYLNQSLRGSRKLHALESHATNLTGQENPAYSQDEMTAAAPTLSCKGQITSDQASPHDNEEPVKTLSYGEVVATLERLQIQLKNLSGALGISGPSVEAELDAVRTLLIQKRFATTLATNQLLKSKLKSGKIPKHYDDDTSNLARDCVEVLEEWQSSNVKPTETLAIVEELTGLLTTYEIEGLLLAHDLIISYVDGLQEKQSPESSSPSRTPSPTSSFHDSRIADNIKIIRIEKTNEPLGATVRNEGDAVIIGRVVKGGAAAKSGLFNEGDEVLEVNGVEMRGKSVNEVCDILASMQGSLTFLVLPTTNNQRNNLPNNRHDDSVQIHHVRAHFDYDPEEDPYIPCRELGVSFQKGDVLHVISQEDSNWWQAHREGEEDQTLAGLVPSKAFQHQRESMKQTIAGGKTTMRGSKKSSTLLCNRKNPKKKKKRSKFGGNVNEDGYPLYATATIDDYDSEEVLTYEEVGLYYPSSSHKRPVVLIGPPNIGRHELRQRLMQDSERFAAAIPHTSRPRKGSEVDGQDYHFISRSQFESDILCRKFVEHGEYEKAYYGTSIEAIRSVVNSGKICVLNLHPQSLKILRSSDLKPYVVFVAPPSLEKLRQKRIKNNESFKEEELKDIIEKAREMEDKYGHLFDMIIINNDTDRAYNQLVTEINSLEREPQWVPASWLIQ
ncbi:hypothetical protein PV328_011382 [Microctonus aethiopoides]|uniref:MAGUK p55 subfamily member 5 n=1 Tax=Microctonus aethiopoides TaxID=144406 RepID=A0AA39C4E1_9HYME|nr:hypothetical protein PV328_011382 [Microctonus aethiopoides]